MNRIFYAMIVIAFLVAAIRQVQWEPPPVDVTVEDAVPVQSPMEELTDGMIKAAKSSVDLAISLIGMMALFLGLMKVAEKGGALKVMAKLLRPAMIRLFPDVPPDHPAMGAMILNFSANALGLGNAATPFGIRAMQELDKLNSHRGTATNSMALFLAINTSSITILPTGVIGIRAAMDSSDPAGIMGPTLFATLCSTTVAIIACKTYQRFAPVTQVDEDLPGPDDEPHEAIDIETSEAYPVWVSLIVFAAIVGLVPVTLIWGTIVAPWIIPVIMLSLISFGFFRGVPVYEVFVEGAKEGFDIAVKIIPYLVAILVAVGMVRASGALGSFVSLLGPITGPLGLPAEALPMALIRPLSGSGAMGVMMSTMEANGVDSYVGYLVSTLQGSTETTFYVLAVYFGAVQVRRIRHAMAAALTADAAGIVGAVVGVWLYVTFSGL
jgi:spore maturation protein SpmA